MSSDLDLNTEAPAAPWLYPALAKLRLNTTSGLAPLSDRLIAGALLHALECDGPAPEIQEYLGGVALVWSRDCRSLMVRVTNGHVYAGNEELPRRGILDRLRRHQAAVRSGSGCEDDTSKGE